MTIREMQNTEEFVYSIVEDLDTIPDDAEVTYEVWAIGYDKDNIITDAEMLLGSFEDPDFAVSHAKAITLADVVDLAADDNYEGFENQIQTISIEVETVVSDGEDLVNIGTIYKKSIEVFDELLECVSLTTTEYELLEDGNLQISCDLLKDYNKNDIINIVFAEEEPWPIPHKIISKTTSGYYICELVI